MKTIHLNRILAAIFPILLLILGDNCMADNNESALKKMPANLVGFWVDDCGSPSVSINLDNTKDGNVYAIFGLVYSMPQFENFEERIFIAVTLKMNGSAQNKFDVYFKEVDDAGESVSLPWDDFDMDVPIGAIELLNNRSMKFIWLGLMNKKTQNREWKDKAIWISEDNTITLKKCLSISSPEDYEDIFNQYSFKQENDELIFYFNIDNNKGKIVVDNKEYLLNKIISADDGTYSFSGENIKISSSKINPFEDEGGDCTGGSFDNLTITIISDGSSATFNNATMTICF